MTHKLLRRTSSTLMLLLVVALLLSVVMPSMAQQGRGTKPVLQGRVLSNEQVEQITESTVTYADGRVSVIVTLADQPAVTAFAAAGGRSARAVADSAARVQAGNVLRAQQAFAQQVSGLGAQVVNRTYYLTNTVTVAIAPTNVQALSMMPGVLAVHANQIIERNDTVSVPLIGSAEVWSPALSVTGAGTVIAVIDTGIDYTHTHFGGDGSYNTDGLVLDEGGDSFGAFPIVADGDQKVVGGYDFVGDAYNAAAVATSTPAPDEDPIDCPVANGGGHGSHVAGTAAGWGVNADGTTYVGPFNNTIFTEYPDWSYDFKIGPGVAPRAALLAMRVFGCNGSTSTDTVVYAIDSAVAGEVIDPDDLSVLATFPKADVINMSLGSSFGTTDPLEPYSVAVANAALEDVAVVTSSGNSGFFHYITGSPGAANEAISTANTVDQVALIRGAVTINESTVAGLYNASVLGFGPSFFADLTGDVVYAVPANGCTANAPLTNAAAIVGKIALIDRGVCEFSEKGNAAFLSGAIGVIIANNQAGAPFEGANGTVRPAVSGYNIPSVMVSQADGNTIKAGITEMGSDLNVTLNSTNTSEVAEAVDTLSTTSSRGPSTRNANSFKPDIAAPGTTITSARAGTGDEIYTISGTSMASPHIAGAMALLMEQYPDWSVAELKALIMNTANNDITVSATNLNKYGPQSVGAGRVDLVDAFTDQVIAYNALNPAGVSVSFGFPEVIAGNTLVDTRDITIQNNGTVDAEYAVSVVPYTNAAGVAFSVDPATITVLAGDTETVTVTLTANPNVGGANTNSDATLSTTGSRAYLTEEAGYVVLDATSGATIDLRVPVYAAPTVNSDLVADAFGDLPALGNERLVEFTGAGVNTGGAYGGGNEITALVSAFELAAESPDDVNIPDRLDLKYVGVTTDYQVAAVGEGVVYFALATHGEWETLNDVEFDIYIDGDQDGVWDVVYFDTVISGASNTYVSAVFNGAGTFLDSYINGVPFNVYNTYPFQNNVVVIPASLEWSMNQNGAFDYWIESYDYRTDATDTIGSPFAPLTYDPTNPAYSFNDLGGQFGGPYAGIPAWGVGDSSLDALPMDVLTESSSYLPDVLAIYHHNAFAGGTGTTAQVIEVNLDPAVDFALISPINVTYTDVSVIEAVTQVQWEESVGATDYEFTFTTPDDVETVLNLEPNVGDLVCATDVCTLTINSLLDLITINGEYVWSVTAINPDGQVTAEGSFSVDIPAPTDFALLSPADGSFVDDPETQLAAITWEESVGAGYEPSYNFMLIKVANDWERNLGIALELNGLTQGDPGFDCVDGVCTLSVDAPTANSLTKGQYLWFVQAIDPYAPGLVDASNASFGFSLDVDNIDLVKNGGFEINTDNKVGTPDMWARKGVTLDSVVCGGAGYSSACAHRFVGSAAENSRLIQNVLKVGVGSGDELEFSAWVKGRASTILRFKVTVAYMDASPATVLTIPANGATVGWEEYTGTVTVGASEVRKITVLVQHRSLAGRHFVDNISLVKPGLTITRDTDNGFVPLPEAPAPDAGLIPGEAEATQDADIAVPLPVEPGQ